MDVLSDLSDYAIDEQRQHYRICYDDGDIEWMKIPHKDVKLMSSARGGGT